ncbi:glycoside hydrolase family 61 protein [Lentinula aciculospora]|uniref:lytic cellulose monooxygenase (C4-dehydrogenating) n=1 Tax=Lentinula aciculospora TaxID=153920 RepID=A0A9W9DL94_9AGAR|nr:glycoside hydrolase family 61 protein [Lentinula aciculospora]
MITTSLFTLLPLLPLVSAHGWLNSITIESPTSTSSRTYTGNIPNASPTDSPIRQINNVDPVKGTTNEFLSCGQGAEVASQVVEVNAGDSIGFAWVNGDAGPWVHNAGPMQTYMSLCGDNQTCSSFNAASASWFKIQEQGRITAGGDWFMSLMNTGAPANVTIPLNIKPGNYIIRHELIALQIAQVEGGAEFYPACVQVSVIGDGEGAPMEDELVSLPGAYSDTDPGILVDVYSNPDADYVFPGPAVAAFVSENSTASTAANTTSTSSTAPSSCKKRRSVDTIHPRTLSRVMKSLLSQ